jgi:hypothetical protein
MYGVGEGGKPVTEQITTQYWGGDSWLPAPPDAVPQPSTASPSIIGAASDLTLQPNFNSAGADTAGTGKDYLDLAARAQAPYGGVDAWEYTRLKEGDTVAQGYPSGTSRFFTDPKTIADTNENATIFSRALQISQHPAFGYRTAVQFFRLTDDLTVPTSAALANPAQGAGGATQYFIHEDFAHLLDPIQVGEFAPDPIAEPMPKLGYNTEK